LHPHLTSIQIWKWLWFGGPEALLTLLLPYFNIVVSGIFSAINEMRTGTSTKRIIFLTIVKNFLFIFFDTFLQIVEFHWEIRVIERSHGIHEALFISFFAPDSIWKVLFCIDLAFFSSIP
jgi:hypothetical protein